MKRQVNLYEAKTHLSQLVEDAARGDVIVIAKNGKPKAQIVLIDAGVASPPKKRELGQWAKLMSPEELAYHSSPQFERDWKEWDKEIEDSFDVLKEDGQEYRWNDTSSTPTPSSVRKKGRTSYAKKPAKRSKTRKTGFS
jgi:prevent-host-death family protein